MAQQRPKSQILAARGHRLPLELEARLAAHCAAFGDPAADVVADAVELLLDGLIDGVSEEAVREIGPGTDLDPLGMLARSRR